MNSKNVKLTTKTDADKVTSIGISEENRKKLADLLNDSLNQLIDLSLATKHAHWNLRGPQFYSLHKLFDDLHAKLLPLIDEVAERVSTIGFIAEGRVKNLAEQKKLGSLTDELQDSIVLNSLTELYAEFVNNSRSKITQASDLEDETTADLLTEVQRETELLLWFLEGHKA